jgi:hypothetical protein
MLNQRRITRQSQRHRYRLSRAKVPKGLAAIRPGLLAEGTACFPAKSDALACTARSGLQLQGAAGTGRHVMEANTLGAGFAAGNKEEGRDEQGREPTGRQKHSCSTTKL